MGFNVGESSNQRSRGRMGQQWHQSQRNDQRNDKGSWIKRKLNNIRLKKLHDINKIGILESQQENRNKEEFKARRLMNVRCYKCKEKGHFVNNCPVWKKMGKAKIVVEEDKETELKMVVGTNSEHKSNILYTHGIGGIELTTKDTSYTIPYVLYVPEININVLSMKQLILQGFEVEIMGDKCNITHMFDPINGKKDKKDQSERMEDGLNGQDQIEVNGKMVSLKVHTIEEFIQFMELMNTNKIAYKHKEVFTRKFNDTLKWFHKTKAGKDLEGKLPPKISNVEICLFDFYKFINNCRGYGKVSQTGEWMEIAKYYGFLSYCDEDLKKTFEDCLLLPHTYYEFSKGRKPNKYANGLGLEADVDGSHSSTGNHVLQTDPDSKAFQRYYNLCALNVTPTLEGPSFDAQGSLFSRSKRVAQLHRDSNNFQRYSQLRTQN
ncbi:ARID DNA-binding domain-containing protein, partial [Tanacetum coccineum]